MAVLAYADSLNIYWQLGIAACILLVSLAGAWLTGYFARLVKARVLAILANYTNIANTITHVITHTSKSISLILTIDGVLLAALAFTWVRNNLSWILTIIAAVAIAIITNMLATSVNAILKWIISRQEARPDNHLNIGVASFMRRCIKAIVFGTGIFALLGLFGISLAPLFLSLGIGGIAVALAAQSTLENFLAGIQITSDKVRPGDFIEINKDLRGYVVDVGLRSTKIRTSLNTLIIVPNATLAKSILTNYSLPTEHVSFIVHCGVSYENDLSQVRKLAMEVATDLARTSCDAVKSFEIRVCFDEFGESNVIFWVFMQAIDRLASLRLKSELIIRLQTRFRQEGIRINYPLRLTHPKEVQSVVEVANNRDTIPSTKPAAAEED